MFQPRHSSRLVFPSCGIHIKNPNKNPGFLNQVPTLVSMPALHYTTGLASSTPKYAPLVVLGAGGLCHVLGGYFAFWGLLLP